MEAILCKSFPLHKLSCKEHSCKYGLYLPAGGRKDACPVKDRDIGRRDSAALLYKAVGDPQIDGKINQGLVFRLRQAPAEIRIRMTVQDLRHRGVLVHDTDENTVAVGFIQIAQDRAGVLSAAGQGQMTDQDAVNHDRIIGVVRAVDGVASV